MSDGAITLRGLTVAMHRLWCGPNCPLTEETMMLDRPITECVVNATARPTPPALPDRTLEKPND